MYQLYMGVLPEINVFVFVPAEGHRSAGVELQQPAGDHVRGSQAPQGSLSPNTRQAVLVKHNKQNCHNIAPLSADCIQC